MVYRLFRWLAATALQWFYRDIEVEGVERISPHGPLLLAVNHPNALIDALVVGAVVPRRVTLTAKATLFENPFLRALFALVGIVPLRRARDEAQHATGKAPDTGRNVQAFETLLDSLGRGAAILIFPEGVSHDSPALAPLKTGLARLALQARDERGVRGLTIVPIGLTFEQKWAPRTRVFVHVGEQIAMDAWRPPAAGAITAENPTAAVEVLTDEVEARLRAITLNFPTADEAERLLGMARLLAGAFDRTRSLGSPDPPLADEVDTLRRIEAVRDRLPAGAQAAASAFLTRLEALRTALTRRRIAPNEVGIATHALAGVRFALREAAVVAALGPVAWWGTVNHWLPIRLAQSLARHVSKTPEDPAMYTLSFGLAFVLAAYSAQTALVWRLAGPRWALAYLASLPIAALWNLRFRDRMRHARRRMRTYFRFRRDPALRQRLEDELAALRQEALALEAATEGRQGTLTEGISPPSPSATHRA